MYISKISFENIRSFANETIDLTTSNGKNRCLTFVGDNGAGKTTILSSIAMGLCDTTGASGLLGDTAGDWISWGKNDACILIELVDPKGNQFSIETKIRKSKSKSEQLEQVTNPAKGFPWKEIFACGYGANRTIAGEGSHHSYSAADSLYTLFNYSYPLHEPELMLRRYAKDNKERKEICSWLDRMLMLPDGSTTLEDSGLKVKTALGKAGWGAIADGHEATITLILDMLGWALLADKKDQKNQLAGIVLIDEIEQHLHPKWQRNIFKLLHETFPNIQFIATTHSPLCAQGLANITDSETTCVLSLLYQDGTGVKILDNVPIPYGQRVDQVLASELFELPNIRDDFSAELQRNYAEYISMKRPERLSTDLSVLAEFISREIGTPDPEFTSELNALIRRYQQKRLTNPKINKETLDVLIKSEIFNVAQSFLKEQK